jgi:cytochrome c oxidase subunit I
VTRRATSRKTSAAPKREATRREQEDRLLAAWAPPKGWRYWSAVNNSEVGLWYTATAFSFLLFGGILALVIRSQLAVPGSDLVSPDLYNQIFTMHGSVMMFLFAVPILEAVAILLLPELLGARDLPFPRLSAFGFWCFLIGGVFVCGSIFFNAAPSGGWFMYPPLTSDPAQSGIGTDIWLLGLSFIEIASIAAAVELIVGVLKFRAPGMRINLIPLYAWYTLVVGGMILFAFPPLIAGDILLEVERAFGWPFFDAERGGSPLLWQHLFWIFGHPEVYIIFLPGVALIAMIVPTFVQRPVVGYSWIVLAAVGTGFLSFGLWVHHMYTTGLPAISLGFFSAASAAVAIPTAVQIFAFIATVLFGRLVRSVPMLFAAGALAIFVLGGLSGVMVALAPFDWQAHDTYFIVAHLHYVLIGGMVFPVIAGLYYYFPFATGKKLSEAMGRIAFWLMFIGFNVAFLPMHITGLRGMPRRVYTYPEGLGFDTLNLISTIGAFVLAIGFLIVVIDVLRPKGHQPYSERNPWNAGTLEWLEEMPDMPWGVRSIPFVKHRYPLWDDPDLIKKVDAGEFYLPDAEELRRETLVTSVLDAQPLQCLRVPAPTFLPAITALLTGGAFIAATFHWYLLTLVSGVLAVAAVIYWLWTGTAEIPEKAEKDVGFNVRLPLYTSGPSSVGWWAMFITMLGDAAAFASLVFAYFFYWTTNSDFPQTETSSGALICYGLGVVGVLGVWALTVTARRWNSAGAVTIFQATIIVAVVLALASGAALLAAPYIDGLDPQLHAYPAIVWILVLWTAAHLFVGVVMLCYCLARSFAGRLTPRYDIDISNVTLYWHFVVITGVLAPMLVALFPLAA